MLTTSLPGPQPVLGYNLPTAEHLRHAAAAFLDEAGKQSAADKTKSLTWFKSLSDAVTVGLGGTVANP